MRRCGVHAARSVTCALLFCSLGEVPGEVLTVMHDPEGLRQLADLPPGSAEAELGSLLPLVQVYQFLETTRSWTVLGEDVQQKSADLRGRIRAGEEAPQRG